MPYYVYRVLPFAQLHKLAEFDNFKQASTHAKQLRTAPEQAKGRIKVMFADDEMQAEDLLCMPREAAPDGDD
jgi:hypothetical protein